MKYILIVICFGITNILSAQQKSEHNFLVGAEYDTRDTWSIKSGVVFTKCEDADWSLSKCFHHIINGKYNISDNAIGAQYSFGYSHLIGYRGTLDYEYNLDTEKGDFYPSIAIGIDFESKLTLYIGPKFNFTKNNYDKSVYLNFVLEFQPSIFFEKGQLKNIFKQKE